MDSTGAPQSYQSLIEAQQRASATRAPSPAAEYNRSRNAERAAAGDNFSRHIGQGESGHGRTAGQMPVWSPSARGEGLASRFAPQGGAESGRSIDAYLNEEAGKSSRFAGGNLAAKYGRDSNPQYADVSIGDFVDIVNPLHHIPLVSTLYREITGDEIKPPARILGGGLYGGPLGMASSMVNAVVEDQTGADIGDNMVSMVTGRSNFKAGESASAQQIDSIAGAKSHAAEAPLSENRPVSFENAKQIYAAQGDNLDIEWQSAPAPQQQKTAADDFFKDDTREQAPDISDLLSDDAALNAKDAPSPYMQAFGPGSFNANGYERATKAYGDARTSGAMPSYEPETLSLKPKNKLAQELRMDNPAAREPVTRISFD